MVAAFFFSCGSPVSTRGTAAPPKPADRERTVATAGAVDDARDGRAAPAANDAEIKGAGGTAGGTAGPTGTAEELLAAGMTAFRAGDFAAAEAGFRRFAADFADSPETAAIMPRVLPLLAISQIRLRKFAAATESIDGALADPRRLAPAAVEELRFWRGACALENQEFATARRLLDEFAAAYPQSAKRAEALLLAATALVLEEKYAEAAAVGGALADRLGPPERGRAVVLRLYALVAAHDLDGALAVIRAEYPRLAEVPQIVGFQTLALQVGSALLEAERYRDAIACLQRVWKKERLLQHQEEKLERLKIELAAAEERRAEPLAGMQLAALIVKVERETREFAEIPTFDAAVRLRLAAAFQGLARYREAGLILDELVAGCRPNPRGDPLIEPAAVNRIRCWLEVERWGRAAAAAAEFAVKFPKSAHAATALFLKAHALSGGGDPRAAAAAFAAVADRFPKAECAANAWFMAGFSLVVAEDHAAADAHLAKFPERFPDHPLAETAFFWRGMAQSLAKQHETAAATFAAYLDRFRDGRHRAEATYRAAFARFALKDYPAAIAALRRFLRDYGDTEFRPEALLLLGDALGATGKIEGAIAAYRDIPPPAEKFFTEGWFKIGKALRLLDRPDELLAHMEEFRRRFPDSPRLAEAVYWIGWVHRGRGQTAPAKEIYWAAIRELGDRPDAYAVEDLFLGLAKLHPEPAERAALAAEFARLAAGAARDGRPQLATRARWAEAKVLAKTDAARGRARLADAAAAVGTEIQPADVSPTILADFAEALDQTGQSATAAALYRDLLKWHPRAPQKDRALAGLALFAYAAGDHEVALGFCERFVRETAGSSRAGEVLLAKAAIERAGGRQREQTATLEQLLATAGVAGQQKARALVELGEALVGDGRDAKAIAYFQRVYVMYARWADLVARAYLGSGAAFERLHDPDSAARTYRELLARADLAESQAGRDARARLARLEAKGDRE